jgi:WD40 repeat protein
MGEVWRASDLKLRVEVALKKFHQDVFLDADGVERIRGEVRAARQVVSPNVCRIYDLVDLEGHELVSMEHVDGRTLLEVLQESAPLELKEADDIASQLLAGLEAIHQAGLIHRDVKPENIMISRTGRVVLMDFGLARPRGEAASVSGTPAYMAPEQARGEEADARADVYSAAIVLAEMVNPEGSKSLESRRSFWKGIRQEPPRLPDSPWAPVLHKAIAAAPEERYPSARALARALEAVTRRVEGADDLKPYPGLASFTEADAEFFYGREAEVEQIWKKLEALYLLAVVGPSGAGKSSFLTAGVIPARPEGWAVLMCTPGSAPSTSLAQALAAEAAGDTEAVRQLLRFAESDIAIDVMSRWKGRHHEALIVLDQFEELFTLNPPEVQEQFATLIHRVAVEAEVHVVLSIRDDFLVQCNRLEPLRPVFSELTPVEAPRDAALRRALLQPALRCGYRFEDEAMVDGILNQVEGERGALPMLAFAVAQLWDHRDRDRGLLTREAYDAIGGVGGALSQHAELTLGRIGAERVKFVREIFRNLVTAEGTRATRDVGELMSVFADGERAATGQVLEELIVARLLNSYEIEAEGEAPSRRVEIIHESLLANWPRLVRWRSQDAGAAQMRDQLRQAARIWEQRDRPEDLLWSGTAYREFLVWRERYPGRLSELEEAFAHDMVQHAGRRRRRRRLAYGAILTAAIVVAMALGTLWRRSVSEGLRAEASKLVALGQLEMDAFPTGALAYATRSIEIADSPEARRLALESLWRGPTAFVVDRSHNFRSRFTADGKWLVQSLRGQGPHLRVVGIDGSAKLLEKRHEGFSVWLRMSEVDPDLFLSGSVGVAGGEKYVLWSAERGKPLWESTWDKGIWGPRQVDSRFVYLVHNGSVTVEAITLDGERQALGKLPQGLGHPRGSLRTDLAGDGAWAGTVDDGEILVVDIDEDELGAARRLGRHPESGVVVSADPKGRFLATRADSGTIRLWDPTGTDPPKVIQGPAGDYGLEILPGGKHLSVETKPGAAAGYQWIWSLESEEPRLLRRLQLGPGLQYFRAFDPTSLHVATGVPDARLWRLGAPADAEPVLLRVGGGSAELPAFHPSGQWLATSFTTGLYLWPLVGPIPAVMRHDEEEVEGVAFDPAGRFLVSSGEDGVRLWPAEGGVPAPGRLLLDREGLGPGGSRFVGLGKVAVAPDGEQVAVGSDFSSELFLVPSAGGAPRVLEGKGNAESPEFSPDGRLIVAAGGRESSGDRGMRVWDLVNGEVIRDFEMDELAPSFNTTHRFGEDGSLLSGTPSGLWRWDLSSGQQDLVYEGAIEAFDSTADGRRIVLVERLDGGDPRRSRLVHLDLDRETREILDSHGDRVTHVAFGGTGTAIASADDLGLVRVGKATGDAPHLLLGHSGAVNCLAIDPKGRWVATGGSDGTVRLWPFPDLEKPPLHTLARDQILSKLRSLTNLRVKPDEASATGWVLEEDPFLGWTTAPGW